MVLARTLCLLCLVVGATVAVASDVILKPTKSSGHPAAVVMVQGASIPVDRYTPVLQDWQAAFPLPLYVAIPQFPLEMPNPLTIASGIDRAVSELHEAGLPANSPIFLAGHSLGGAMLGMYTAGGKVPNGTVGQILMGSFVERKYYDTTYPVPTLTLGGELDGLCRCTRIAEAYHNYVEVKDQAEDFPVVILGGVTHMQFASGTPPALVKDRDLVPEVTYAQAHQMIAQAASAFMLTRLEAHPLMADATWPQEDPQETIAALVAATGVFAKPIIASLELEGYYSFTPPCYEAKSGQPCQKGSPWMTQMGQSVLAGLPNGITLSNTDQFASVENPLVHPSIDSKCPAPSAQCVVVTSTVTENRYNIMHAMDTGFVPISAFEMAAELNSREAVQMAAGLADPGFNATDAKSLCKLVNEAAHQYAVTHVGQTTLARFQRLGEPYLFEADSVQGNYPAWDPDYLLFKQATNAGVDVLDVVSPSLVFKPNFPVYGGQHWCKLLSPARAVEWMYVDGLRKHDSIANATMAAH